MGCQQPSWLACSPGTISCTGNHSKVALTAGDDMQCTVHSADVSKHVKAREAGDRIATLFSLPHDTLGKINQELSFQDKCRLELSCHELYDLLSSPSPAKGLWGTCDLMLDLKVKERFDSTSDITR